MSTVDDEFTDRLDQLVAELQLLDEAYVARRDDIKARVRQLVETTYEDQAIREGKATR